MSETTPRSQPHPITVARPAIEVAGMLMVLASAALSLAIFIGTMVDDEDAVEGAGDFFLSMSGVAPLGLPLLWLGMFVSVSPRLFFRWDRSLGVGVVATAVGVGSIVAVSTLIISIGALAAAITRASDIVGIGVSFWSPQVAYVIAGLASVVLAAALYRVGLSAAPDRKPAPQLLD